VHAGRLEALGEPHLAGAHLLAVGDPHAAVAVYRSATCTLRSTLQSHPCSSLLFRMYLRLGYQDAGSSGSNFGCQCGAQLEVGNT